MFSVASSIRCPWAILPCPVCRLPRNLVTSSRPPTMGQAALSLSKNEEAANIKEYQFDMEAKGNVNYQAIWANP